MDGLSPQTVATNDVIPAARASAASASSRDGAHSPAAETSATLRAISAHRPSLTSLATPAGRGVAFDGKPTST